MYYNTTIQPSSTRCVCVIRETEGGRRVHKIIITIRVSADEADRHVGGGQRDVDYLDGQLNPHIIIKYLLTHGDFQ